MEKIVGWFILAATAMMILALGYYSVPNRGAKGMV